MGDQYKFLYREKNGVDLLRPAPEETLLEAVKTYFDGTASGFPGSVVDVKLALEYLLGAATSADTYSHQFTKSSGGSDFWLGDGDSGNSSDTTFFIPTTDVRPLVLVFSNRNNASPGNPFVTRMRAHYKPVATNGDILVTDPTEFDISNSGPNLVFNHENGRIWLYDMLPENITMFRNRKYGIRTSKTSGAGNYQSITVTLLMERL